MESLLQGIGACLGTVMRVCFTLCRSYGAAILLFTLFTKLILLPLSVWVQKNGVKVVRMQPAVNRLKIARFGDPDAVSEGLAKLYRQEKYNPLASLIPLALQIVLLMGVIEVIYHPLTYLLGLNDAQLTPWLTAASLTDAGAQAQLQLLRAVAAQGAALASGLSDASLLPTLQGFGTIFAGIDLTLVPSESAAVYLLVPLATGASALVLALTQNHQNPLQHEQSFAMRMGTMAFSVGLSLYLGYFVPVGVALYWMASNLYTIVQQVLLNRIINPKKFVNYEELAKTREELAALSALDQGGTPENRRREKTDYKRFFAVANKHLVFYAESRGFYKYFAPVLEEIFRQSNLVVHYITSDPEDPVLTQTAQPRLHAYYIGPRKLITLMMKMDADVVVMTMSDLDNYHYKRSYVRRDCKYIYMFHYPLSTHMVLHTGALDHYDEILCVGDFQISELRAAEKLYGTPEKELAVCGYCQLDSLYKAYNADGSAAHARPRVLLAPSWQPGNLLDGCLDDLLTGLLGRGWDVTLRPHPEYMKRYRPRMEAIMARWRERSAEGLTFECDFSSNASIWGADTVITDWSGTGTEFAFVTGKPCVFVDTPPKINNPDYVKLGIPPQELVLRDQLGIRVAEADAASVGDRVAELLTERDAWAEKITAIRDKLIAHFPDSAPVSAAAILQAVVACQKRRGQG